MDNDYHIYYEYLEEYGPYQVFDMVMNGENLWTPLIKPEMYQKALSEFVEYGQIQRFPVKYIYQWMGIIMKNTAILRATTDIAGHSPYFPIDDFFSYFFNDEDINSNGVSWEDWLIEHDLEDEDDYQQVTTYLDEVGFYDNLVLPDGSDAWSDYGLEPIEKLILKYNKNKSTPEETLVLINKILDVYHQRGDLSSMFIEGGAKTLTKISYNEAKNKKIIMSENKFNKLIKNLIQ